MKARAITAMMTNTMTMIKVMKPLWGVFFEFTDIVSTIGSALHKRFALW